MSNPYDAPQRYRVVWNQTAGQYATKATVAYIFARSLHEAQQLAQAEANLGVVRFRSVAPGVSALKLEEVELINGKGERIPVECLDAAITVIRAKE